MNKAKVLLAAIGIFAVVGGALAFKAKQELKLYYLITPAGQESICVTVPSLTTTNAASGTVTVPSTGTGWYTTDVCSGPTFRARTINN